MMRTSSHTTWPRYEAPGAKQKPEVCDRWSAVRVSDVAVVRAASGDVDARVLVHACVHLGGLTPADVRVDVHRGRPSGAEALQLEEGVRLWSTQRYDDGVFLFEGRVPAELSVGDGGVSVRVRPAVGSVRHGGATPVIRWSGPVPRPVQGDR